jgi:two-component system invasion response regulator UvrY
MRILIVDDHAIVRRGLRQLLSDEYGDVEVGEAGNAAEALEHVHHAKWDVIILDISMPGRSGLDVLKEIKKEQPAAPVLVLSMHPEDQLATRALKAGASGYMTKESATEELVGAVNKVLEGGNYVSPTLAELLARDIGRDTGDVNLHERLSDREYEVMIMIASGKSVSEIADELSLSVKTISTYRARVLEKVHLKSNAELARYAIKHGLVD